MTILCDLPMKVEVIRANMCQRFIHTGTREKGGAEAPPFRKPQS